MPVIPKPVTAPDEIATDATYSSGPAAGNPTRVALASPAQGFVPGTIAKGPAVNFYMNQHAAWSRWVYQGTSTPDPFARIVETDDDGVLGTLGAVVGGVAADIDPLTVSQNTGLGTGDARPAMTVTASVDTTASALVEVTTKSATNGVAVTCEGAGAGVVVYQQSADAGVAVQQGATGGPCVQLTPHTTPERGALSWGNSTAHPTAIARGDMWRYEHSLYFAETLTLDVPHRVWGTKSGAELITPNAGNCPATIAWDSDSAGSQIRSKESGTYTLFITHPGEVSSRVPNMVVYWAATFDLSSLPAALDRISARLCDVNSGQQLDGAAMSITRLLANQGHHRISGVVSVPFIAATSRALRIAVTGNHNNFNASAVITYQLMAFGSWDFISPG